MAYSAVLGASEEKTNGTRISRLLIDGGTHVSRMYFDSLHPPGTSLLQVLNNSRILLEDLKKRRVIRDAQWEKLFPPSGVLPDTKAFDITLLHLLIRGIYHPTLHWSVWNAMPADSDQTSLANIIRIRCFRNNLSHRSSTGIPGDEFDDLWDKISSALVALGLDQTEIDRLKTEPIEHDTPRVKEEDELWRVAQELQERLENVERDVQQLKDQMSNILVSKQTALELSSYRPDEVTNVFGRDEEIDKVVELIKTGKEAAVLITGGPGFGKTTVANKAAHELAKPGQDRTVFFCNIMSMKTVDEVATRMSLTCSKHLTQLSENPSLRLLNWSKQVESRVTFVLDNADDVLDRNGDDCNKFWRFLGDCRTLSKQNVNFIITSRLECNHLTLQTENVRLGCLSIEEANKVVSARMRVSNLGSTVQKLSKAEKLVELCGYVPLALCVAGSLLSKGVYTEGELIKRLEEEPTDVLQCDRRPTNETSVAKSIMTSLLALDDCERQAIILLCSFPGSFNADAAKFVISNACSAISENQSMSILGELVDRSLVDQSRSHRYEIHALIKASAKKFGQEKYPQLFAEGEKMACAYFMSCLHENARLYWSKDTCKASTESFSKDRHNFEYFLGVYAQGMDKNDPEIANICKMVLQDFLQTCMYLEMCLSPRVYVQFLESLLKSFKEAEIQCVHVVEIMCLLGHETRKVGQKEEYKEYMEEAKKLYSEKSSEFSRNPISEVFYMNSYADFVSKQGDPAKTDDIWKLSQITLKTCDEKLEVNHPEKASTLLLAGRFAKLKRKRSEAEGKYEQALKLFLERLGKHVKTVNALKEIGDFFLSGKTEEDLEKALGCYKQAEQMMHDMGMESNPQNIHILKNYGICFRKRGNFPEARKYILKAYNVAETELEADHMWKVMIKNRLAVLHEDIAKVEETEDNLDKASTLYKEAIEMLQRLKAESNHEGIRTRQDYGMFLMRRGKVLEAMDHLERAYLLADRELEPNHMWKVTIKIQLALLNEKVGKIENAKGSMKDGLTMLQNREMKVDKLWNSTDVLEFLERHRKDFPKSTFPR